jgi:hypothetical protein
MTMKANGERRYRPTESKYKGGADEMYVTYDVLQETRDGHRAIYPKVKRVYIAGKVTDWAVGNFAKRTGRQVHGVKVDYEQSRARYARKEYTAQRGRTSYKVSPSHVGTTRSNFTQIVEVPSDARNVRFRKGKLPEKYQSALQSVR